MYELFFTSPNDTKINDVCKMSQPQSIMNTIDLNGEQNNSFGWNKQCIRLLPANGLYMMKLAG